MSGATGIFRPDSKDESAIDQDGDHRKVGLGAKIQSWVFAHVKKPVRSNRSYLPCEC